MGEPKPASSDAPAASSIRLHQIVLAASVAVPALILAAASWHNHGDVMRAGADTMSRTAAIMQEHARKVFETAELAIGQVDERIDGQDAAAIAGPATARFLRRLEDSMDQVTSIAVTDAAGTVVASSRRPGEASPTVIPQEPSGAEDGTHIGTVQPGTVQPGTVQPGTPPTFPITRRRTAPDGRFAGTIQLAASPGYFARFYATAAPPMDHLALLLRDDGAVLARDPPLPPSAAALASPMLHPTAGQDEAQLQAGIRSLAGSRLYVARRVPGYPVSVVFAVPRAVLLQRWHRNLALYAAVAACASLTLLGTSWLALRRARAEQQALARLRAEIAQRQAAEAQLRHAQRMDAVGQLTGGVAHDFNNLLTAILGNLELIQRSLARPDALDRITRLCTTAIKAVERGSSLTRNLLAFARKQPMHPTPVDANALVTDFQDFLQQAVGVAVAVRFHPAPDLPPCLADPAELQGALLNLAINARDAMPDGGRLTLATALHTLGPHHLAANPEARPGRFVAIAVADTGPGMTPDVAAKAFEPFFTTKPPGQGTGLGLSQVFGFARQLGGHVTIGPGHEAPGHEGPAAGGTTVTLFLPVTTQSQIKDPP